MSIAEKLATVAENIPKVYKAGQSSMVDESKIIEKTVSGAFISVDDVSEIPHNVGIQLTSDTVTDFTSIKVRSSGKNLIPYPYSNTTQTTNGITFTDNGDGSVTANGTAKSDVSYAAFVFTSIDDAFLIQGGTYTMSGISGGSATTFYIQLKNSDTDKNLAFVTNGAYTFNLNEPCRVRGNLMIKDGTTVSNLVFKPQLELSSTATEYEPYNGQTFTPNADGTVEGMTSLSPYMNVFTDNADGNISMTYRKSWGMQEEYDRFWDSCQNTSIYPKRCGPAHFAGTGWNNDTFKPKYDIKVSNGYFLFYNCGVKGDLVEILDGLGVSLDTSEATSIQYLFWISRFTRVGEINLTGLARVRGNTSQAFSTSTLITIDKMIVNENNVFATNTFTGATKLANIIIEGTMADNISFPDSPLSKESILSVFNALSSTATGLTLTLKLSAVNKAFETSEGAADGSTSEEWATLIATKPNWTISLV